MPLKKVRDFLARRAYREINIYQIEDFNLDKPEVIKQQTRVKTFHENFEAGTLMALKAEASNPFDLSPQNKCQAKGYKSLFGELGKIASSVKSKNQKIKRYVKQDVNTHKAKLMAKPEIDSPMKQVQAMPQERPNILKFQKKKPAVSNNEMILACYGPIVEGAVERLVLNKKEGTLFVWYSAGSRQRKARNVYLIRRLGRDVKPEWRWL